MSVLNSSEGSVQYFNEYLNFSMDISDYKNNNTNTTETGIFYVGSVNISDPNGTLPPPEPASMETIVLLSFLFCIIGTTGLIGNSLVIIVILFDRKMRQSLTNIFIMNLAAADFVIMLIGVPEIVQFMMNRGWLLGTTLCRVNRYILVVSLYVSILSLVFVCIER